MKMLEKLNAMRTHGGAVQTHGLDDETVLRFAQTDERLAEAVDAAYTDFLALLEEMPELMVLPEDELVAAVQDGFVNFYPVDAINPYVALGASGPPLSLFRLNSSVKQPQLFLEAPASQIL